MAAPSSLLKDAHSFARDMARDAMAPGYLWDVCDFVPSLIDTLLTSRGAWVWGSDVGAPGDYEAGILAPFTTGEQNLGAANGNLYSIGLTPPYSLTSRGAVPIAKQNPLMLFDQVVWLDGTGAAVPSLVTSSGVTALPATAPKARYGTVWGHYAVLGNQPGHENTVYFSPPSDVTLGWDPNALVLTAGTVTGLAALRTVILVFHADGVERIRGSRPPAGTKQGDLVLEPMFNQIGLTEPKTIAYWQENIIFADEHGVHITDGAVLRNLVQQGSIQSYWRNLYNHKTSLAATVFLDYYIISINRDDGINDTLICDLNQRQWFRFSNIPALSLWASGGTIGMERIWGGIVNTHRVARLSSCFFPATGIASTQDGNGNNVLPSFETPFYKLAPEGRKRVRFVYLSYDARSGTLAREDDEPMAWGQQLSAEPGDPRVAPLATGDVLQCSFILSPQDTTWTVAGTLPATTRYTRYRNPVNRFPYGVAFQVKQIAPTLVTRISDLSVDAHVTERGRV